MYFSTCGGKKAAEGDKKPTNSKTEGAEVWILCNSKCQHIDTEEVGVDGQLVKARPAMIGFITITG